MNELSSIHDNTALDGVAGIGGLLSATDESAIYEAHYPNAEHATVVEVRRADSPDAEHRLARWSEAMGLSHANLLRLHAAGRGVLNDVPVIYLVKERADESLAEVLSARALTSEEGSAMAGPTLSALEYLHKKGYALGRTEPSNILAVGDTLKLSAEEASHTGTPADDMFAFGKLLLNALTGGTGALEGIQEPLHGIVKHCIDPDRGTRWTAGQALRWLAGEPVRELPPRRNAAIEIEGPQRGNHKLIYGIVAALLLMAGLIRYARRPAQTAAPQAVASAPSSAVPSNVEQPVTREPVRNEPVPPPAPAEHAQREPAQTAPVTRHARRSESWVVVIASYGARGPAEKRTRETAKRWPRFHVELVEAASEKARLLVVIGRNLSEKEAEALRNRARSSGLPRDTYIKRIDTGNG